MVLGHLPGNAWKLSKSEFSSIGPGSERVLHVGISDQKQELCVQIAMGIRFMEVEEIWRRSQNLLEDLGEWTVHGVCDNWLRKAQLNYTIDHPKDIQFYKPKVGELIDRACVPFWTHYATVADLNRDWNSRPFEFHHDGTDALHHAMRSLIAAKLVNNPEFSKLITSRRAEVTRELNISLQQRGLDQFDKLVAWLRKPEV
jgi:hypothetical protein